MNGYTPMMQQYLLIKEQHPDSILFFRLGDFYEMFFQDAKTAERELDLTLTAREAGKGNRVPMAGIPHHAAENYIARLIEKGYTVAICDQVEDPKEAKGVVKREVTRIITPGTVLDPGLLTDAENNYLCAVTSEGDRIGIAAIDISTGLFICTQMDGDEAIESAESELARLNPAEILISTTQRDNLKPLLSKIKGKYRKVTNWHETYFTWDHAHSLLSKHLGEQIQGNSTLLEQHMAVCAAGAVYAYVLDTQKNSICHITDLEFYEIKSFMVLDATTRRNLELTHTMRDRKTRGSLLWILDRTKTAMGSRCIRHWVEQPLRQSSQINQRLDAVEELYNNSLLRNDLQNVLGQIKDLERLISRSACGQANARDILSLAQSLSQVPAVVSLLREAQSDLLSRLGDRIDGLPDLVALIAKAIVDDPPLALKDGGLIRPQFNEQIDQYRIAAKSGKSWLSQYETEERARTGIKNLKIGYNRVFGYYFTVTNSYSHLVPENYQRKQTLANAERYTTEQLMEYESQILGAEDKLTSLEYEVFCNIRNQVNEKASEVLEDAQILSVLDAVCSLAETAVRNLYTRPKIDSGLEISIQAGRHPVVEQTLPPGEFVSNDTIIGPKGKPILLITGPNMAGKSTYMRQTALIVLMAQIGSFVPAEHASIGLVDRIFTRVGAQDDLTSGQSTFMIEMNEMAHILHYASPQSLLLLDEVGRGTSTFDGLSIAWAVTEYIHNNPRLGCKTMFATHYHELTDLEDLLPGVKNLSISVREKGEQVIFLRKIIEGGADRSYGIQVARLAGLPGPLLVRAKELLYMLEKRDEMTLKMSLKNNTDYKHSENQLQFFKESEHPVLEYLRLINVDETTPLQALQIISELKQRLEEGE